MTGYQYNIMLTYLISDTLPSNSHCLQDLNCFSSDLFVGYNMQMDSDLCHVL